MKKSHHYNSKTYSLVLLQHHSLCLETESVTGPMQAFIKIGIWHD